MNQVELSSSIACKNCQITFEGKFCPSCSQKADTHRFSLSHFAREAIHAITHTDKGIFFLIKELITKPGTVALEYNSGMRKKYFNPITFLLIMTALHVFVAEKTGYYDAFIKSITALTEATPFISAEELQKLNEQRATADKQYSLATENGKLLTLLYMPFLSFFTWGFFKKSGHNYAENLVFNVMINGEMMFMFFIVSIIPFLFFPSLILLWMFLFFLLSWIYNVIAYKQFYKQRWFITIIKGLTVQVLYLISVQQITGAIASLI